MEQQHGGFGFDDIAKLVSRVDASGKELSKNEWKRQVRKKQGELRKEAKKRERPPAPAPPPAMEGVSKRSKKEGEEKQERNVQLVFDCAWEELMTDKEVLSLAGQIKDSMAQTEPCSLLARCLCVFLKKAACGKLSSDGTLIAGLTSACRIFHFSRLSLLVLFLPSFISLLRGNMCLESPKMKSFVFPRKQTL